MLGVLPGPFWPGHMIKIRRSVPDSHDDLRTFAMNSIVFSVRSSSISMLDRSHCSASAGMVSVAVGLLTPLRKT